MKKILIIIPAYNEAENLPNVISSISNYPQYDYLIINDGSKDNTVELCKKYNWNYLDLPINMGLTAVVQTGMRYARKYNYDYAIQFDGDGQHRPEFISSLLNEMEDTDIAIGSRFIEEKKPGGIRMLGSNLIQFALLLTTGKKIKDPTSGMRLYNKKIINILADEVEYGPEPDTLAYLLRCGAKVKEIQVKIDERLAGESYLNLTRAIKYMMHMFFSISIVQFIRKKINIKGI